MTADESQGAYETLQDARLAKAHFRDALLGHPDVHGLGVGLRRRAGQKTGEYALVVHVKAKLPLENVSSDRLLPTELRIVDTERGEVSVRIDVQEHVPPVPENDRIRPVPGGVSAGASGTLGGWVWDTVTSQVVAISNAHVFGTDAGRPITQPSTEAGGHVEADSVATVVRAGSLDAAIAAPVSPSVVTRSVLGGGPAVFVVAEPRIGMHVQKAGFSTGLTFGVVDLVDFDADYFGSHSDIWVDGGDVDFSSGGDSGSLYLEADTESSGPRRVIGLHWGGSGNDGVGHQIACVFRDLHLSVLPH